MHNWYNTCKHITQVADFTSTGSIPIIQVFAFELVTVAVDFVPLAVEFGAFAAEFVPFAVHFVMLVL